MVQRDKIMGEISFTYLRVLSEVVTGTRKLNARLRSSQVQAVAFDEAFNCLHDGKIGRF